MARKLKTDRWFFLAALLLVSASLVMVYSASAPVALHEKKEAYSYLTKQVMWAALGLASLILAMRFDYRHFKQPAVIWTMLVLSAIGLLAVFGMHPVNGSRRWIFLGGLSFQPSEFAKLSIVVFTAAILERRMHRIDDVRYSLLPIGIAVGLAVGLVYKEPDFGTAVTMLATCGLMIFVAGLSYRYVIGATLVIVPAAAVAMVVEGYRTARLLAFLDPWKDPLGHGFQLIQSMVAVGSGGIFGRGIGWGIQKWYYLPYPHNDFIYAVIGEEAGLIGATLILACFAVIAWRGLRLAGRAPDAFASLMVTGITAMISLQAFFNMSVVLGLLPTKGIPLPLVSAGGSSLLVNLLAVGILLNISQYSFAEE